MKKSKKLWKSLFPVNFNHLHGVVWLTEHVRVSTWPHVPVVTVSTLGSFVSRSLPCSGDALANRLNLLFRSQKSGNEKRAELATLLKDITRGTSDSVIEDMTNSVVEL